MPDDLTEVELVKEMLEYADIESEKTDEGGEVRVEGSLTDLPEKEVKQEAPPAEKDASEGAGEEETPEETASEETEGDEIVEEEKDETPEETSADDEPDPLLARAKELGLGDFKDVDAFLESQKNLRTRLSQRDDHAAYGRQVLEAGYTPERFQELAENQEEKPKEKEEVKGPFQPPHPHNPAWDSGMIRAKTDEEGHVLEGQYTGPPDEVRKYVENIAYEAAFWQDVKRDPTRLVSTEMLDKLVEERMVARERVLQEEAKATWAEEQSKAFMAEHGEFVKANTEEFFKLVDHPKKGGEGMLPERAIEYLQMKANSVKTEPEGEPAKKIDALRAAKRTQRRAGAAASPARKKKVPAGDKTSDEMLEEALAGMSEAEIAALDI